MHVVTETVHTTRTFLEASETDPAIYNSESGILIIPLDYTRSHTIAIIDMHRQAVRQEWAVARFTTE